jgi:hypothetical protein
MEIKNFSSFIIKVHSKITDFVLHNKTLTESLEWIVDQFNNINLKNIEVDDKLLQIQEDYQLADNLLNEKIETISFESDCDTTIEYIPNSGNKFKITRVLDDMQFESSSKKLTFTIPHNLGIIPIIQIYTKIEQNEKYSITYTDFEIDENELVLQFTEEVYCLVIFKA